MFATGRGPIDPMPRAWMWLCLAVTAVVAVLWFLHRMPLQGSGAVAFGVVADVATSSCLFVMDSSADALVGAVLFAVPGAFFTFYLSRRWLAWHTVYSTAVIIALATVTIVSDERDAYITIVRAYLIISVVQLLPFTIHGMWGRVAREAQFANTDHLTGVLNRRGMLNHVEHELAVVERGSIVACVVVDIDAFKSVNDTHGHTVGDLVIAHTAAVLSRSVDGSGVVARTGGEEFTIVIIDTPYAVGTALAQIPTTVFDDDDELPTITLSVGAATTPATAKRSELVWHTIARADRSMYAAKAAGGRQFIMAGDGN